MLSTKLEVFGAFRGRSREKNKGLLKMDDGGRKKNDGEKKLEVRG